MATKTTSSKKTGQAKGRKTKKTTTKGRQRVVGRRTGPDSNETIAAKSKDSRGHLANSRKGKVHAEYDEKGADAAIALGTKLDLKQTTLRSWIGTWQRADGTKKKKAGSAGRVSKSGNGKADKPASNGASDELPAATA